MDILAWIVGIVVGVVFAIGVLALNIQKWVVLIATSVLGAGVIVGTFLFMFGGLPSAQLVQNPVRVVLQTSPFWAVVFLVIAVLGIVAQYQSTRSWNIATYNRWETMNEPAPAP
jgi:formate hydrogenlyase subunit 3/multisubunit Na+/H+ antiporter MnhD subunit